MAAEIDKKEFLTFVKTLEGKELSTLARRTLFSVNVAEDTLSFTPLSSGMPRREPANNLTKVINYFNTTQSLRPKEYQDFTFNSVYIITLLELYKQYPFDQRDKVPDIEERYRKQEPNVIPDAFSSNKSNFTPSIEFRS